MPNEIAGRTYFEIFNVTGRRDLREFIVAAIESSGAEVVYKSPFKICPMYFGVRTAEGEQIGLLVYPFRMTAKQIKNRPSNEVRGQLRYGGEANWRTVHFLGKDPARADITLLVGIDVENNVFLGLDSNIWDPLPLGISFYAKREAMESAAKDGWYVWERTNRAGTRRREPRSPTTLETLIAFKPENILAYAKFERHASLLGLDPALRYSAAQKLSSAGKGVDGSVHELEEKFSLSSDEILSLIHDRNRLEVAVRGGVAELHLEKQLKKNSKVAEVNAIDVDSKHDFDIRLKTGQLLRVECKNASPKRRADGTIKVEVQKTRASKNDPASRYYSVDAFDVVAACLFSPTGEWKFKFIRTSELERNKSFPDRLAAIQLVTSQWSEDISMIDP